MSQQLIHSITEAEDGNLLRNEEKSYVAELKTDQELLQFDRDLHGLVSDMARKRDTLVKLLKQSDELSHSVEFIDFYKKRGWLFKIWNVRKRRRYGKQKNDLISAFNATEQEYNATIQNLRESIKISKALIPKAREAHTRRVDSLTLHAANLDQLEPDIEAAANAIAVIQARREEVAKTS